MISNGIDLRMRCPLHRPYTFGTRIKLISIDKHLELVRDWAVIENKEEELDRITRARNAEFDHCKKKDRFSQDTTTALKRK